MSREMSVMEFRSRVETHLRNALEAIPNKVPADIMEIAGEPFVQELEALDELLNELGREARIAEDQEAEVARKVEAKRKVLSIEHCAMRIDRCVQKITEDLGTDERMRRLLMPMTIDNLINAVVLLLDHAPALAIAPDRIIPPGFASSRDSTVAGIIQLLHERRARGAS